MPNLIAFSTLGCGEWSRETVIERAAAFGYDGIEWRGGPEGHVSPELPAAEYAAPLGLIVAPESHDNWVRSAALAEILAQVPHPALRALWDFGNAFADGEDPLDGLRAIGPWLGYVHVKDGVLQDGAWRLTQLGQGQLPLKDILRGLLALGYTGALTFEWERAFHPELEPAETAFPTALGVLRQLLAEAEQSKEKSTP